MFLLNLMVVFIVLLAALFIIIVVSALFKGMMNVIEKVIYPDRQ